MKNLPSCFKTFFIPAILFFLGFQPICFSQTTEPLYSTGFGVRIGNAPGVSLKKFMNERAALEAQVELYRFSRFEGFVVTALYERHLQAFGNRQLNWFFGGGVHAGAYTPRSDREVITESETDDNGVLYGVNAIGGLEYKFLQLPFSISADIKPGLTFPTNRASAINGAITLRWVW